MNKTGFGFLRFPRVDPSDSKSIDHAALNAVVDRYMQLGGKIFDTAYTYLDGLSEAAIRTAVSERYPRESFVLSDKLPGYKVTCYEDCRKFFNESLQRCGVEYFDIYLLHWLSEKHYAFAEKYDEFRFLREVKEEGKAGKIGFSFHDSPELLDKILTAHPEVDRVLLQINYLDWESPTLQARRLYETALRHGKEIMVMEPVKGGRLATLPEKAEALLRSVRPDDSPASWAIRFAMSLENVRVVLSGMNSVSQVEDNMRDLEPLSEEERKTLVRAAALIRESTPIGCTGCGYCTAGCPIGMPIPTYFSMYNDLSMAPGEKWKMQYAYDELRAKAVPASSCVRCRSCEFSCPQKLGIIEHLKEVAKTFEK